LDKEDGGDMGLIELSLWDKLKRRLNILEGADTVAGSVAKTVKDAVDPIDERLTGLDTLIYEGITYRVSKRIENGHLVTVYTEVA